MDTAEEGDGRAGCEGRSDTCVLACVEQIDGGTLLHNTGGPAWRSVLTCKGGMWAGGGRFRREGV